jgi:type II secretory pathway pseudopilin PulG
MAKKKMKTSRIVLLVILVIIIAVVAYQKYGVEEAAEEEEEEEAAGQQAAEQEAARETAGPAEEAQPLYPDLCYAAGGKPVAASRGCGAGEENIGDVPGFRLPHICCVKQ